MTERQLILKELLEELPGGYPPRISPFLECPACQTCFYMSGIASLDWVAIRDRLPPANLSIELNLACDCRRLDARAGAFKKYVVSFECTGISLYEVRTRILKEAFLERRKLIVHIVEPFECWGYIRQKVSNFLLLPFGFEDQ